MGRGGRQRGDGPSAPTVPGTSGRCARWQSPAAWKHRGKLIREERKKGGKKKKPKTKPKQTTQTSLPERCASPGASRNQPLPRRPRGATFPVPAVAGAAPEPGQRRAGGAERSGAAGGREGGLRAGLWPVTSGGEITPSSGGSPAVGFIRGFMPGEGGRRLSPVCQRAGGKVSR